MVKKLRLFMRDLLKDGHDVLELVFGYGHRLITFRFFALLRASGYWQPGRDDPCRYTLHVGDDRARSGDAPLDPIPSSLGSLDLTVRRGGCWCCDLEIKATVDLPT